MADGVKFIFKTLIKVPCIIMVCYFVLNIFMFMYYYFKMLGISYEAMQVVVENNYIPPQEFELLNKYIIDEDNKTECLRNCCLIIADPATEANDDNGSHDTKVATETNWLATATGNNAIDYEDSKTRATGNNALKRKQYGKDNVVGVHYEFQLIWPLTHRETTVNDSGVNGLDGNTFQGFKSASQLEQARNNKSLFSNINIYYRVPGLKYYPDLKR